MPKIVITEQDLTTPGTYAEDFNVVYIPGFVNSKDPSLTSDGTSKGEYIGLEAHKPTLFTSVSDFEAMCGKKPATFNSDQQYEDLPHSFSENAVPVISANMFKSGDYDPSYVLAKELLNEGLSVLYERVNDDTESTAGEYQKSNTEYSAGLDKSKYFIKDTFSANHTSYSLIDTVIAPDICSEVTSGKEVEDSVTYYKKEVDSLGVVTFVEIGTGAELKTKAKEKQIDYVTIIKPSADTGTWKYKFTQSVYTYNEGYYIISSSSMSKELDTLEDKDVSAIGPVSDGEDTPGVITVPTDWEENFYKKPYVVKSDFRFISIKDALAEGIVAESGETVPLVSSVTPFYTKKSVSEISIKTMYDALDSIYDSGNVEGLVDKGNYSVKFLTSGGYPVYEYNKNSIVTKMLNLAESRGDCYALIDHTDNLERTLNINSPRSVYGTVRKDQSLKAGGEFGAMFTPWATYNRTTSDKEAGKVIESVPFRAPASFAYLLALADSIKTNASWLAVAGSARGAVLNLTQNGMTTNIPNGVADAMQPRDAVAVNAITNIKPYGHTIWGNRTLFDNASKGNLTASSFLNIRNLVCDIKKVCYRAARKLTFEQNTDVLWVNFKAAIAPTLDRMKSGYGISGYKIIRDYEHEKASEKATVCAKIHIYPVYAVEDFYISIILKDDEVSVE